MASHPSTSQLVRSSDDDFEGTVMKWFEDCNVASDIDSDCDAIESDHESDSIEEQSIGVTRDSKENIETEHSIEESEFVTNVNLRYKTKFLGKNKFLWTAEPNTIKR